MDWVVRKIKKLVISKTRLKLGSRENAQRLTDKADEGYKDTADFVTSLIPN